MLEQLKEQVLKANLDLVKHNLVVFAWGSVSGIDRENDRVVINPEGIPYNAVRPKDMVVLNLYGQVVEGKLKPSNDAPTHLVLYRQFKEIGGIVHVHSKWATSWAQAGRGIPALGTTHAEYFNGEIPCTEKITPEKITGNCEMETGRMIVERFKGLDPQQLPAVLVNNHGAFSWGTDAANAVGNAVVLEKVARMAYRTLVLNPHATMDLALLERHYTRKHDNDA